MTSDDGKTRTVHPNNGTLCSILIDSNRVDSSQYKLFNRKNLWTIGSIDTIGQTVEFTRADNDKLKVTLHKDQIRYLEVHFPDPGGFGDQLTSVILYSGYLAGSLGVFFGVISLPMPSTPWKEDMGLIVRGAGVLGVTVLVGYLVQDNTRYGITGFH